MRAFKPSIAAGTRHAKALTTAAHSAAAHRLRGGI
jgi:hypothetical protein